ncbi:unnamed protein product [Schistocephalus solidus]|uniref:Uncharacterized protein n=1 Tax=Schistocephalus solidus TaxID=70667 RepID=A0A183TIJ1_SCHSO|nr:unnamed protein product [Schistocephalus solidus]
MNYLQSEAQPAGIEKSASCTRTGALQDGHRYPQQTRFSEQRQPEKVGAGYTFFCSGHQKTERRDAGVAFAIRKDIIGRLTCLPWAINERHMTLRLRLRGHNYVIISAYAPAPSNDELCCSEGQILRGTPCPLRLFRSPTNWSSGQITLPARSAGSPRSCPSDLGSGHVDASPITALAAAGLCSRPRRDPQDVQVTKTIRDADGWTDHHFFPSKKRLRLQIR